LTICNASKIEPIIVLSKVDLIKEEELEELLIQIKERTINIEHNKQVHQNEKYYTSNHPINIIICL
jgi:putative ribosome biogenesis GTPase RsgA